MKKFYTLAAAALMAFAANAQTEMQYEDLTTDMFHAWTTSDASATLAADQNIGCSYDLNVSTGLPYGNGNVKWFMFANLSEYDVLEAVASEGEPRFCFNRLEGEGDGGTVTIEFPRDAANGTIETVIDNGDGTKTYCIDLKAIVESAGFAYLHCIKGANWANTTLTSVKVGKLVETPTSISTIETANGKAIVYNILGQRVAAPVRGQIYIVNGRKMTL